MSEILDNIYIWVFLVNIESVLLLALVKYMLCSHFTQNCYFIVLFGGKKSLFCEKKLLKIFLYLCIYLCRKNSAIDFTKTFITQEWLVAESCPTPRLNRIFNALWIGVQYTLSFQWTNFGLKCRNKQYFLPYSELLYCC